MEHEPEPAGQPHPDRFADRLTAWTKAGLWGLVWLYLWATASWFRVIGTALAVYLGTTLVLVIWAVLT